MIDEITTADCKEAVEAYKAACATKSDLERTELNKDKTGMISSEVEAVKLLQLASLFSLNTTIACIVTNAKLDKAEMNKVAAMASNGIARTIRPVNTSMDGDSVYAMATGKVKSSADVVGTLAAHVLGKAVNRAVLETDEIYGMKSAKTFLGVDK